MKRRIASSIFALIYAAAVVLVAGEALANPSVKWVGDAPYRLLVRVDPIDLGSRSYDERPAELKIDWPEVLRRQGIDAGAVDMRSVRIVRYSPQTGEVVVPRMPWAFGQMAGEAPFRWYDDAIPYDFPEMQEDVNATNGKMVWTNRVRWGYFYDVVGDWKNGRLDWMHAQEDKSPSYYAVYFNTQQAGTAPWHSEPRGFIGDNLQRTVRESSESTGLIHTRIDAADWDGDGLVDLVVGCSRGGIIWYKNLGTKQKPQFGAARMLFTTDGKPMDVGWTSSPKMVDWDGDGDLDLISGAEWNRIVWYENVGTNKEMKFVYRGFVTTGDGKPLALPFSPVPEGEQPDGKNTYQRDYYPVLDVMDWDGGGKQDLIAGGYVTGRVYRYKNTRAGKGIPILEYAGEIQADGKPIDVGWAAAPLIHDFDGDCKPDLILGNMKMTAGGGDSSSAEQFLQFFKNVGEKGDPVFKEIPFPREGMFPKAALGTPRAADFNGDGLDDLIVSTGTDIYFYQNIGTRTEPKFRVGNPPMPSEWGNAPLSATQLLDWNGDGLLDQVIGYSVALNTGKGNPGIYDPARSVLPEGQVIDHRSFKGDDWVWQRLFDLDGDGRIDALDGDHTGNIWFHRNIGTAQSPSFDVKGQKVMREDGRPIWVGPDEHAESFDIVQGSRVTYAVADFNGDGRPDLAVGNYIGVVRAYQQLPPDGAQLKFTQPKVVADLKQRLVPFATDWDGDGKIDIIAAATAERFMFIRNLGNEPDGTPRFAEGIWVNLPGAPFGAGGPILVADFNHDGDDDLILQTAYGYTVWVERSFLEHGYAKASLLSMEKRTGRENAAGRIAPSQAGHEAAYPSIARLSDGRLLCVYSTWDGPNRPRVVIEGRYSLDDGKNWGEPFTLIDSHPHLDYDPAIVVMGDTLLVTSTTVPPTHAQFISTSRTMAVRSEDNGKSWSSAYEIPMPYRYTSGKINNGLFLPDETAMFGYSWDVRLQKEQKLDTEGDEVVIVGLMVSKDRGKTWSKGPELTTHVEKNASARHAISGLDEPAFVICPDGSLYMLARSGRDHLYESRSGDNGRTWSEPVPSPLVSHNSPASLCAFGGNKSGILAVWNNSPTDRWPLCAAVSFDEGKNWSRPYILADTPGRQASYPGCIQAADGALIIVWQQDHADGPRTIESVRLGLKQLLDAKDGES